MPESPESAPMSSSKPILDPDFWRQRLTRAVQMDEVYRSVFETTPDNWLAIEARHREVLARHIQHNQSILDCGCGYGRLLLLLPGSWRGTYVGVDLSPDFVRLARQIAHTGPHAIRVLFYEANLTDLSPVTAHGIFDWAVLISIRDMIINNLGVRYWDTVLAETKRHARKVLILEYDPTNEGEVLDANP